LIHFSPSAMGAMPNAESWWKTATWASGVIAAIWSRATRI